MPEKEECVFCNTKQHLSTLGEYCLCASCQRRLTISALEFAKRNTTRGTVYHAAFSALCTQLLEETENEN